MPNSTLSSLVLPVKDTITGEVSNQTFDLPTGGGGSSSGPKIFFGTCDTAAATADKIVTCSDFTENDIVAGTNLFVKFDNTNTSSTVTLTINGTTTKNATNNGATTTGFNNYYTWVAGQVVQFIYDGTNWQIVAPRKATTDYGGISKAETIGSNGTASSTTTKYRTLNNGIGSSYKDGSYRMKQTVTLSTSSTKTVTFTNSNISTDKMYSVYTSIYDLEINSMTVTAGTCTIVFPKYTSAASVDVVLEFDSI